MLVDSAIPEDRIVEYLWTIAGLCEPVDTLMFVTSVNWALIAKTVINNRPELLKDITPQNFNAMKVGCLTVVNSGSEDQEAVDEANKQAADRAEFQAKRLALISGKS